MSTLTKVALSIVGQLKPDRAKGWGAGAMSVALPPPQPAGGMPLMEALAARESRRDFSPEPIAERHLSNLLWAAFGVNRAAKKGRTAPTARDQQEIDVYVAMREGIYLYEPFAHKLALVAGIDARVITGYQDFVDEAPLDLVYVANHRRADIGDPRQRLLHSAVACGAIVQNVYLYCTSTGLATVVRGWFDHKGLAKTLELSAHEHVLVAQTVGYPRALPG
jgi:SagB-type dehydrogenase family enzyme